jgi:hypothetical protein
MENSNSKKKNIKIIAAVPNLTKKEKLVWAILFSNLGEFDINIEEYSEIDNRSEFREEIRTIIKRGGITITEDRIIHKEEKIIWKILLKR